MAVSKIRILEIILYRLKLLYPTLVDFYKVVLGDFDLTTGKKTITRTRTRIQRGLVLPQKVRQQVEHTNVFPAVGGLYQLGDRELVLDTKDLPSGTKLTKEDYFIIDGDRYDVVHFWTLEQGCGYYVLVRKTQGAVSYQIQETYYRHPLMLTQTISGAV